MWSTVMLVLSFRQLRWFHPSPRWGGYPSSAPCMTQDSLFQLRHPSQWLPLQLQHRSSRHCALCQGSVWGTWVHDYYWTRSLWDFKLPVHLLISRVWVLGCRKEFAGLAQWPFCTGSRRYSVAVSVLITRIKFLPVLLLL